MFLPPAALLVATPGATVRQRWPPGAPPPVDRCHQLSAAHAPRPNLLQPSLHPAAASACRRHPLWLSTYANRRFKSYDSKYLVCNMRNVHQVCIQQLSAVCIGNSTLKFAFATIATYNDYLCCLHRSHLQSDIWTQSFCLYMFSILHCICLPLMWNPSLLL